MLRSGIQLRGKHSLYTEFLVSFILFLKSNFITLFQINETNMKFVYSYFLFLK
jgi:hypothetical protein